MLRVADGLDRGRRGVVAGLDAQIGDDLVVLRLHADDDAELELWGARRRRDLFEKVFDRELEVVVEPATAPSPTTRRTRDPRRLARLFGRESSPAVLVAEQTAIDAWLGGTAREILHVASTAVRSPSRREMRSFCGP